MNILVTGGAGFIGSHIVDRLVEKTSVTVIDNLSNGDIKNVNKKARFIRKDINSITVSDLKDIETVFHLAADPEVRISADNPNSGFENNVTATFNLLEACRKADIKKLVFTSTSTVYGEANIIPTPENYPCEPISNYGASKLACEAYLSSYANSYGIKATVLRYANIFGERSNHGVMYDFFHKLKKNKNDLNLLQKNKFKVLKNESFSNELEILGNGKQEKSYLHVSDCVSATLLASEKQNKIYDVFNVGSEDKYDVDYVAKLVCKLLKVNPKFRYTGTERGWVGDVKIMQLSVDKIKKIGWKQRIGFDEGVKRYMNWLKTQDPELIT